MATGSDQALGYGMVSLAGAIFLYYTVWMVVLPFVDGEHVVHQYFLPWHYAIIIPVTAGLMVLAGLAIFLILVSMKNTKSKDKSS